MNLLGFDTATAATSVCVLRADGTPFESALPGEGWMAEPPRHTAELMPAIERCLTAAGVTYDQLESVAVGVGPGTFTGLRIGVATARALAQSCGLQIRPVSTLKTIATALTESASRANHIMPIVDAKRGELFYSLYRAEDSGLRELWRESVDRPERLVERVVSARMKGVFAVGDGAVRFADELRAVGVSIAPPSSELHVPRALQVCCLALQAEAVRADAVEPAYIRAPDAARWR